MTHISSGITFIIFTLIILYHAARQLLSLRKVKEMKFHLVNIAGLAPRKAKKHAECRELTPNSCEMSKITHTSIELCEPLITKTGDEI